MTERGGWRCGLVNGQPGGGVTLRVSYGALGGEDVAYVAGEAGEDIVAVKRVVPGER